MDNIPFYPDHYLQSQSKEIQTILQTVSQLVLYCSQELEQILQNQIVSDNISKKDAMKILSYLGLPYTEGRIFTFLKRKFTPSNIELFQEHLNYLFQGIASVSITMRCQWLQHHEDQSVTIEEWDWEDPPDALPSYTLWIQIWIDEEDKYEENLKKALDLKPFLERFFSYMVPPYWDIRVVLQSSPTIEDLRGVDELWGKTLSTIIKGE